MDSSTRATLEPSDGGRACALSRLVGRNAPEAVPIAASWAAATLELATLLPKATAAYQGELSQFAERIAKNALTTKQQETLQKALTEAVSACSAAQTKVLTNEVDLRECGFSVVCEAELLSELRRALVVALRYG